MALAWALQHPANARARGWALGRWCIHQVRKRWRPTDPVEVSVGPARLVGPPRHPSICLARYVRGGLVDLDAFLAYAALLAPGGVFVDVGAAIGLHSVFAGHLVGPGGEVVACEPDREARPWLERNLERCGASWRLETKHLADRIRWLAWRQAAPTLSHLSVASREMAVGVETTTLDELIPDSRPPGAVVKIDVEGWEPAVLLGGGESLQGDRVRAIWIEAIGLQPRCDVPWAGAVELCHSAGMRFYVVDVRERAVRHVPRPGTHSPTGSYLVTDAGSAEAVTKAVAGWPEVIEPWLREW